MGCVSDYRGGRCRIETYESLYYVEEVCHIETSMLLSRNLMLRRFANGFSV